MKKLIIIGGNAAGLSAASKYSRTYGDSEIVVYEKGCHLSYSSCGLPYFITDFKLTTDDLITKGKEELEAEGIRPMLMHEVLSVDPENKTVRVKNLATGEEFVDAYDRLFIATGAFSRRPDLPGVDLPGVFTLKSMDDGIAIRTWINEHNVRNVIIIGGGYIGFETAEVLARAGKEVTLLHRSERLLKTFDPEIAEYAKEELIRLGVDVQTEISTLEIKGDEHVEEVVTDRGSYKADMLLLAVGVSPVTDFLKNTSLAMAESGALIVDRQLRTNLPDIYAAGDCAEVYHFIKKANDYIPLATTANKCGRIVGENLGGKSIEFIGTLGSSAVKVGAIELARTGLSEHDAAKMGINYKVTIVNTLNKSEYYHDSDTIVLKMIYENGSRRILGAQGVGSSGVVLRIDVISTAIAGGLTAQALGMQDLCYAPPFATAWDAVNVIANTAK